MTGPNASGGEFAEGGHVFERAIEHPVKNVLVNYRAIRVELARGANQDLAGFARLNVECNRIFTGAVSAFEIAEFDDLVMNKSRVAVGNDEVAFAFSNGKTLSQDWRGWAGGVYGAMG